MNIAALPYLDDVWVPCVPQSLIKLYKSHHLSTTNLHIWPSNSNAYKLLGKIWVKVEWSQCRGQLQTEAIKDKMGSTKRSRVGAFRCRCTTQDTPETTMRPCKNGNLIACSESMGCPSLGMLKRKGSMPWELFFGPVRLLVYVLWSVFGPVCWLCNEHLVE